MIEEITRRLRNSETITEIAASMGLSRQALSYKMKKWGVSKKALSFNESFFDVIDSESKAYFLGFLMADGCIVESHNRVQVKIHSKDVEIIDKWHEAIKSNHKPNYCAGGFVQSSHTSKKMAAALIRFGCTPRKSLTLQFPTIQDHLIHHFVRGYFDGDGCADICNKKQKTPQLRLSFIGTDSFLTTLQGVIGTNNKLQPTGNNKVARRLEIKGNKKASKLSEWLYKDASIFLRRKWEVCHSVL